MTGLVSVAKKRKKITVAVFKSSDTIYPAKHGAVSCVWKKQILKLKAQAYYQSTIPVSRFVMCPLLGPGAGRGRHVRYSGSERQKENLFLIRSVVQMKHVLQSVLWGEFRWFFNCFGKSFVFPFSLGWQELPSLVSRVPRRQFV